MGKRLTITLTDRRPVTVDTDAWPLVATAKDWDNQYECQANRTWRLYVRLHADGRAIVSAEYATSFQGGRDRHGGEIVPAGDDLPAAIRRVAEDVLGDHGEELAREAVADLPAEDLTETQAVRS